jgi:hypothetical protein
MRYVDHYKIQAKGEREREREREEKKHSAPAAPK